MMITLKLALGMVVEFFLWWSSELWGMVPKCIRSLLEWKPHILAICFRDDEMIFLYWRGNKCRELGRIDPSTARHDAKSQMERLGLLRLMRRGLIAVRIGSKTALRKVLDLPSMPPKDLHRALSIQIDRQTPFKPEDAYFDYRIIGSDRHTKRITLELTVVPTPIVDDALEKVSALGLCPAMVDVCDDPQAGRPTINLLTSRQERYVNSRSLCLNGTLALAFLALIVLCVQVPLNTWRIEAEDLSDRVSAARIHAEEAIGLRSRIEGLYEEITFFEKARSESPSVLLVLNELTRIIPDHSWITKLQMNNGGLKVSGYSAEASELAGIIEKSPMFSHPRFVSPVRHDPRTNKERFEISLTAVLGEAR